MKKIINLVNQDNFVTIIGLILFAGFLYLVQTTERTIYVNPQEELSAQVISQVDKQNQSQNKSPISGLACDDYNRRPVAVMLSNDSVTRPLSGLADADIIFEMQVVQNSITRLMAVFVCGNPEEIGSIRSARQSFIPLAMGIDAIYAHWGGSHFALDRLGAGIMDNINALTNPFSAFYRKSGIAAPHNGFSSMQRLLNSASKLGYRLENKFEGYQHVESPKSEIRQLEAGKQGILKINYSYPFSVEYRYDVDTNSYFRWRGGIAETDRISGKQIEVKNVVVMRAESWHTESQYNKVDVEGSGDLAVYRNGEMIEGVWKKNRSDLKNKLYFLDTKGEEIKFVPGNIWVEVIEPEKMVTWN